MSAANGNRATLAQRAWAAIAAVRDPEIGVSLGKLGVVRAVEITGSTVLMPIVHTAGAVMNVGREGSVQP
jgi:metal-sulfur cluster biosynthetic enzyme